MSLPDCVSSEQQSIAPRYIVDTPAKEGHIHGYTVAKPLIRGHLLLYKPEKTFLHNMYVHVLQQDHAIVLFQWNTTYLKREKAIVSLACST